MSSKKTYNPNPQTKLFVIPAALAVALVGGYSLWSKKDPLKETTQASRVTPVAEVAAVSKEVESPKKRTAEQQKVLHRLHNVREAIASNLAYNDQIIQASKELEVALESADSMRKAALKEVKDIRDYDKLSPEIKDALKAADIVENTAMDKHAAELDRIKESLIQSSH